MNTKKNSGGSARINPCLLFPDSDQILQYLYRLFCYLYHLLGANGICQKLYSRISLDSSLLYSQEKS